MDLWDRISGTVRVELTAADPQAIVDRAVRQGVTLHEIENTGKLDVSFSIPARALGQMKEITERMAGQIRVVSRSGLLYRILAWRKRPVLVFVLTVLLAASVYLPGRILFVQVKGNETVPTRLILETVKDFGLSFGASRRAVRSERIKNELLGAVKELEWVGVNTAGSVATVLVRERKDEPEVRKDRVCDLVAGLDGVVERVSVIRGEVKCTPGQAVRKGDVLISGYLDLGICTRVLEAEGEIYARTLRQSSAVLPRNTRTRTGDVETIKKYSLLIEKNRINLYSDSGILMPTCGKMTDIKWLRVPGGLTLPVALVCETYTVCDTSVSERDRTISQSQLSDSLERHLLQDMVAGSILESRSRWEPSEHLWVLTASYECREMIARQDEGVYLQDYG